VNPGDKCVLSSGFVICQYHGMSQVTVEERLGSLKHEWSIVRLLSTRLHGLGNTISWAEESQLKYTTFDILSKAR
jgi:hypothetical protein